VFCLYRAAGVLRGLREVMETCHDHQEAAESFPGLQAEVELFLEQREAS